METPIFSYCVWFFWLCLSLSFIFVIIKKGIYVRISAGCTFLCLIAFFFVGFLGVITSDWISYKAIVHEQYMTQATAITNIEPFWKWVAVMVEGNIYYFRLFVYGVSYFIIFIFLIFFVSKKERFLFLFLFAILGLYAVSEGRQILSVALFYFGLTLWINKSKYFILFIPLLVLCFYLHKGTILFLPSLFLLNVPLNRKNLLISILGMVFVSGFLYFYLIDILEHYFPEYNYSFYIMYNVERDISRRILYVLIVGNFLLTIFVYLLLKKSFNIELNTITKKYRNFLYWNFLFYCCLYILNFDSSTTGRYIGLMLLYPIIILIIRVVEFEIKRNIATSAFCRYLCLLLLYSFLSNNIIISACLDIGEF